MKIDEVIGRKKEAVQRDDLCGRTVDDGIGGKFVVDAKVTGGVVKTHFICNGMKLKSLNGAPREVYRSFWCHNNLLTSLVGGPEIVGFDYRCHDNGITSLEGCPKSCQDLRLDNNMITSLSGIHRRLEKCTAIGLAGVPVTSDILGLLLIDGLSNIDVTGSGVFGSMRHVRRFHVRRETAIAFNLIKRYLPNTKGRSAVIEFQNELLDNGLEEFAKL